MDETGAVQIQDVSSELGPDASSSRRSGTSVAYRRDDLLARLRMIVTDTDLLGREVTTSGDVDLVVRFVAASDAVRRAVLALDPSEG